MDFWQFAAQLEWPIIAVIALFIFRGAVRQVIAGTDIKQLKGPGFNVKFRKRLDLVEKIGPQPILTQKPTEEPLYAPPDITVMHAWRRLEERLRRMASREGITKGSLTTVMETARRDGLLSSAEIDAVHELRTLRNQLAHEPNARISSYEARRYLDAVENVICRWPNN